MKNRLLLLVVMVSLTIFGSIFVQAAYAVNTVVATIQVGVSPVGVAYDSAKGEIFVANSANNTVSVIDDATNTVTTITNLNFSSPIGIAYDSAKGEIFVANVGGNTVSVISDVSHTVVNTIPVGTAPAGIAYDSAKGEIFVANVGGNTVSVIDDATNTVVATISVGLGPDGIAYDSAKGEIFVANSADNTVSVISDVSHNVVNTTSVGTVPNGIAYDSAKGEIFVTNEGGNTVSVISDVSHNVVNTISVGSLPQGIAYDSAKGEIFVANSGDGTVSVISDVSHTVVDTIPVGTSPTGIAYDSAKGEIFVANSADNTVSVISDGSSSSSTSGGHSVVIHHPPSLGNDYYYKYPGGFILNGKSFDITKYGITIPQQVLNLGQQDNFTFKIYDERGGNTVLHVGMYIHFKGDASVANADTSFVWDRHDGVKITDPGNLFANTNVTSHYDTNFAYVSIKFTPIKQMPDSSIIMRMWDDKLASMDVPINGAIIIVDPDAPVPVTRVPDNQYSDYVTLQNILDKDGYDIPALLHKQYSMSQTYHSIDINWVYDKGEDKLTMVESDKSGNLIGEQVYSLFKKTEAANVTDHDYIYIPVQLNRQDVKAEQVAMHQEEQRAEKYLAPISYADSAVPSFMPSGDASMILDDFHNAKFSQLYHDDHQGEYSAMKNEADKAAKLAASLGLVRQNNFEGLPR